MFVPLALRAGLDLPLTRHRLNGFLVDFFWPELGLVVETDGLTYHRTPAEQSRDRVRDQRHTAAGLTCLRFTHHQVANEQDHCSERSDLTSGGCVNRGSEGSGFVMATRILQATLLC